MKIEVFSQSKLKSAFTTGKMDLSPEGNLTELEIISQYFLYSTYFLGHPVELKVTLGIEVNQKILNYVRIIQKDSYTYVKQHGLLLDRVEMSSKCTVQEYDGKVSGLLYDSYMEMYETRDKVSKLLKNDAELNKFFADSDIEINNIDIQLGNDEVEHATYRHNQEKWPLKDRIYYFGIDNDDKMETIERFINCFNDIVLTRVSPRDQVLTAVKLAIKNLIKNSLIFYKPVLQLIKTVNGGAVNKLKVDINIYFIEAIHHKHVEQPFVVEIKDTTGKITDTWVSKPGIGIKEGRTAKTPITTWAGAWLWLTTYTYGKYFSFNTKAQLLEVKKELLIKTAVDISRLQTKFSLDKYKELLTPYLDYIIQNIK